jgi:hypothetical protein
MSRRLNFKALPTNLTFNFPVLPNHILALDKNKIAILSVAFRC